MAVAALMIWPMSLVAGLIRRMSLYILMTNICVTMMKNGRADERFGDSNKTGARNPRKNASPPRVGVGRVCHLSFLGTAVQPHRVARRLTNGTHKSVNRNDAAGARKKIALPEVDCMETAQTTVAVEQLDSNFRIPCYFAAIACTARFDRRGEGIDDALNDLARIVGGAKAHQVFYLARVRHPSLHIFEARFVSLVVGNILNRRRAARH